MSCGVVPELDSGVLLDLGLDAQGLQAEDGERESAADPGVGCVIALLAELRRGQAHELGGAILDIVSVSPGDIDELAAVLIVLVQRVVPVSRELPVAEDELNYLVRAVATARHLTEIGEPDPATLTTTTIAGLHALSSVRVEWLPDVVQPRDVDATSQLSFVDLSGVLQGLATAVLDLTGHPVDVLILGIDEAERFVADVENVVRPVERVQRDLLKLGVLDADEPAPVAANERVLQDPFAAWNDEGGPLDDEVLACVRAGLLARHDVRVEDPPLLCEGHTLGGVGHLNHLLCDTNGIFREAYRHPTKIAT